MPFTLEEFAKLDLSKIRSVKGKCQICKKDIVGGEATQQMRDGIAHDGCYYDELGAELERNPIVGAYRTR